MTACKKDDSKDDPSETTAHAGENPVVYASIATEQLANYEIVSTKTSSAEVDDAAEELRLKMQTLFGIPISKKTENAHNKKPYEILIGNTNREETATFLADMKWDDYGYGIVGDKLVIAGKNEDGTLKALRAFLDYINKHDGGTVFFSNANSLLVQMGYPHGAITFNGIPVEELSILCNQQELGGIAQIIRDAIIDVCGIAVPIITDEDVVVGNKLMIIGESAYVSQEFLTDYQEASISENGFYFATDYQAHTNT